jgi:hypothetical protein
MPDTSVIISICAVAIAALSYLHTVRMRKKDFQTEVFKKQFEAYDKIVKLINENYSTLFQISLNYFYKKQIEVLPEEYKSEIWDEVQKIKNDIRVLNYLINTEILTKLQEYYESIEEIIANKPDKIIRYVSLEVYIRKQEVENEIRHQLSIEKLNSETIELLNKDSKRPIK